MSGSNATDLIGRAPGGRKLIAVVYADMVGYSRLIALDDGETLERLRALRSTLIDPAIDQHGGRIVQTGGDSLLILFDSIDGAVRCAVKVQQTVPSYDGDHTADRTIRFRVGINIGDVIADGTDFHGNAVNVAARLQTECPPGGICVTRAVRDHVHDRLNLVFEEIGTLNLKNITRPIEAFVLRLDAGPSPADATVQAHGASSLIKFNGVDPAVLTAMATTFANEMYTTAEARAQAEARAAELATKLGFTSAAVSEFFQILGKDNVPLEKVPERLIEIAKHFTQTRDTLAALEPDDPHITETVGLATQALQAGRLSDADQLLDQAKNSELVALREAQELIKLAKEAEDRHALNAAKMMASRGEIARTELRTKEAAEHFEQAVHLVPVGHPHELGRYLSRQADALSDLGDRQADNAALQSAIAIYHKALEQLQRHFAASDWALVQQNLGIALTALGYRESGTARLNEAVAAFRLALAERKRDAAPAEWARTQYHLGVALFRIGERERGTTRLEEAITAYRLALQGERRELVPLDWALTQNGLGLALWMIGERQSSTAELIEAASDFRLALKEQTRERAPRSWAETQNNIGLVLWSLGQREIGTARLAESVAAFRLALEERSRDRAPLEWAQTQSNLSLALRSLGQREDGTARLVEAVAAARLSLEERTRDRVPLLWALSQNNLGTTLRTLGARENGTAHLEEAETAYRLALEGSPRDRAPLRWAMAQSNLAPSLHACRERKNDTAKMQEAIASLLATF